MTKAKKSKMIEWQEREVAVADLQDFERNPRKISNAAFERLVDDIRTNGYHQRIIATPDLRVIGGHQRKKALIELGIETIRVLVPDCAISDEKFKEMLIKDNLQFGEFDFGMLTGDDWDFEKLVDWGMPEAWLDGLKTTHVEGLTDEDAIPEPPAEPISVLGDIWILGNHRLMCGDSTSIDAVEKLMDGKKADMLLTDPPYNVAYQGGTKDALTIKNDSMNDEDFRKFLCDAFGSGVMAMRSGAVFYIWHADSEGLNFRGACQDVGLKVRQCLIWLKSTMVMGRQDYQWKHEPCLYGWKDGAAHYWASDRKQTTILEFDKPLRNGEHPTMKPVELFEYQMLNNTKSSDIVLDIFGGSGTTIISAEKHGRHARLMELDPKYCDVIIKRWQEFTGKEAIHAETGQKFNS